METMVRAGQRLEDGMPFEEVADLVPVIAYGLAVDEYRRDARETPVDPKEARDLLKPGAILTGEAWRFGTDFDAAVRTLTTHERDAFTLTELRGLTVRKAADVLDTSRMTVHRRAESARVQLREELAA